MMRNEKFLPVMKGKNIEDATMSGMNGTRNTPIRVSTKRVRSIPLFIPLEIGRERVTSVSYADYL